MPDRRPDPVLTPEQQLSVAAATARRRLRGRNIALFMTLLAWALVMYIAIMVKVHHDIRAGG